MKATGVVRKLDDLGRIVIPKEVRRSLNINNRESLAIFIDEDKIILKKYVPDKACMVTGEVTTQNVSFGDGNIVLSPKGMQQLYSEIEKYLYK